MTRNTATAATRRRTAAAERKAAKAAADKATAEQEAAGAAAVSEVVNAPTRRNLTRKVRNQITEMHDEGKSNAVIASECGIAIEKVEALIAEYAAAAAPAEARAIAKAKTGRYTREDTLMHDGKWSGVRVLGKREDGIDDLGVWGQGQDKHDVAVDAYEAANPDSKYASYITVQQRFLWVTATAPAAVTA